MQRLKSWSSAAKKTNAADVLVANMDVEQSTEK